MASTPNSRPTCSEMSPREPASAAVAETSPPRSSRGSRSPGAWLEARQGPRPRRYEPVRSSLTPALAGWPSKQCDRAGGRGLVEKEGELARDAAKDRGKVVRVRGRDGVSQWHVASVQSFVAGNNVARVRGACRTEYPHGVRVPSERLHPTRVPVVKVIQRIQRLAASLRVRQKRDQAVTPRGRDEGANRRFFCRVECHGSRRRLSDGPITRNRAMHARFAAAGTAALWILTRGNQRTV